MFSSRGTMTTVLVVEDDVFLRDIFQRVLERAGFHVLTAAHGKEALASFHGGGIGLVLTDLMIPELDGFELIWALQLKPHARNPTRAVLPMRSQKKTGRASPGRFASWRSGLSSRRDEASGHAAHS